MTRKREVTRRQETSIICQLAYDPETGWITWREPKGPHTAGSRAGTINADGYMRIMVDGRFYKATHVAWLLMTGKWPVRVIDHANCDRADDRWSNLRPATLSQNQANRRAGRNNKSGYKGVCFDKAKRKWRADIQHNGKSTCLGFFEAPEKAHDAYALKAREVFGEFARTA